MNNETETAQMKEHMDSYLANNGNIFHWVGTDDPTKIEPFWVPIDDWEPIEQWKIMKQSKNCIHLPVSDFTDKGVQYDYLDSFVLNQKRCYNADLVRSHICHYVNYFETLYDPEKELFNHYYRIKLLIDLGYRDMEGNFVRPFNKDDLMYNIKHYILSDSIYDKIWKMVKDNYSLNLRYKNKSNEALQYNNYHGEYLMEISVFQNILIPIVVHFAYKNKIMNEQVINGLLFEVYNMLFAVYQDFDFMQKRSSMPSDVFGKLYETVNTMMNSNYAGNKTLWMISEIRGYNPTISTFDAVNLLIMQMMPKYKFDENMISYNIAGIRKSITYNVTGISYEFDFSPMSSSKRDGEDNASQTDKYEAHLIKTDESLVLHNSFRKDIVMEGILERYGPFDQDELMFYKKRLIDGCKSVQNKFQACLVKDMFYSSFGDTHSIKSINALDYVKLMIAAKRILISCNMRLLPYIIAGHFTKISSRVTLCKKEMIKITTSQYYEAICQKYRNNQKIKDKIIARISTIISSNIEVIDYYDKSIDGKKIIIDTDILIDEVLLFTLMI